MAVEPVVYGASDRPPRGDYARAGADYTCEQDYARYTAADHDTYRRLYERQAALLPGLASDAFIAALPSLGVPSGFICCGQEGPFWVASRAPLQASGFFGAAQRRSPTGGAA